MRIAICDDESLACAQTQKTLEEAYKSLDLLVDIYTDGRTLLESTQKLSYDLIILDIEMPELNGLETARRLRALGEKTAIVFLTSHVEYALKGYEVNALRYLTKPADVVKLSEIITYLVEQSKQKKKLLLRPANSENQEDRAMVSVDEIIYLEARNQDIRIVTATAEYLRRYNLRDYERELEGYYFVRNHRSYLINLAHVKRIFGKELAMDNGDILPISRTKGKQVKEALYSYVQREAL